METNNNVVGSDNEVLKEDWSVVFKLPRTKLIYSEQQLAENNGVDDVDQNDWVDKEDESMVVSNWVFNPQPLCNVE